MTAGRQPGASRAPGNRKPTLRDVARLAGVSTSTASIVFSGRGPVSAATAERVRAAAADLAYAGPDPLAASLRQRRSGIVAVVIEDRIAHAIGDPFALTVIDGLARVLDEIPAGMLLLARTPGDDTRLLGQLAAAPCDAVVFALCGPGQDPAVDLLAARGIPMIGSGAPLDPRVTHLAIDERAASAAATQHLVDLGHHRLAHITLPLSPTALPRAIGPVDLDEPGYPEAIERARGFLDVAPHGELIQTAPAGVESGAAAGRVLLDRPKAERPTGIVAQSDLLAAGVLLAARDLGIEVPGQLSVVGFDGVSLPWLGTELTTIDQFGPLKGRTLGEMVAATLTGRPVHGHRHPARLRIGATSGPAPMPEPGPTE